MRGSLGLVTHGSGAGSEKDPSAAGAGPGSAWQVGGQGRPRRAENGL